MMRVEPSFYISLWNKYRPVMLQLMSAATAGPQTYQLFVHEFKAAGTRDKSFTFSLEIQNGRATNVTKGSAVARDLIQILQQSPRASELMAGATYLFSLDRQFKLHVTRKAIEVKSPEPEVKTQEPEVESQEPEAGSQEPEVSNEEQQ